MTESTLYNAAIAALSRREHTRYELEQKLGQKFKDSLEAITHTLDKLQANGLQSDARYCEQFIRHRVNQGYGLRRIQSELHRVNVCAELIETTLASLDIDWQETLRLRFYKRFKSTNLNNPKDKARVMRYFAARGFDFSDINALVHTP